MSKNNYPQAGLEELKPDTVKIMVSSLMELHEKGKPETDEEVEERISEYFEFCERTGFRPGVEALSMALHISRVTLYNWSKGVNCSERRAESVQAAKAFIGAFIEQTVLAGKISPPSGIFLMKNWLNYKDAISIEETIPESADRKALASKELPKLGMIFDEKNTMNV